MAKVQLLSARFVVVGAVILFGAVLSKAQSAPASPSSAKTASSSSQTAPTTTGSATPVRRRSRRRYSSSTATTSTAPTQQQAIAPTAEQRRRDAQILAAQKAQSAETARQQAIVTGNVVKEREAQQAEPRIQDAPGPGSQPLPGDPAIQPTQPSEPPRIQDAPGPAQTLPKAPSAPTTTPAPQE